MVNISNIQHFCVGDGPGIRTTVFFKGCHMCCPWCHNPENMSWKITRLPYADQDREEFFGRRVAVESILPELLEDKEFFQASGGGVTFSGGEVLLQAQKAANLARLLMERGVGVLVDTAGCEPYRAFAQLNPYVKGYLLDVKTADPDKYKAIGGNLRRLRENLTLLMADGIPVRIRIPLIPGFNIEKEDIRAISQLLREHGITKVDLLPFHRLGSGKYKAMGIPYAYENQEPLSQQAVDQIAAQYGEYFSVTLE